MVSAASIVAKVCRDQALREWRFPEGNRFQEAALKYGSGYPSDPYTKKFLQEHCDVVFGYPQLIRFSWSTAEKAMEAGAAVKWEKVLTAMSGGDDDDDAPPACTQPITNFFRKRPRDADDEGLPAQRQSELNRHRFFLERNIASAQCL